MEKLRVVIQSLELKMQLTINRFNGGDLVEKI